MNPNAFRDALLLTFWLLTTALAVSAADVTYDREHDFTGNRSYAWVSDPAEAPMLRAGAVYGAQHDAGSLERGQVNRMIAGAIDDRLARAGYERVATTNADFLVTFHTAIGRSVEIREPLEWVGVRGRRVRVWDGDSTIETYPEGTLVVDVIDAESGRIVWRSAVTRGLSSPTRIHRTIDKAVAKALKQFPAQGSPVR